MKPPPHAEYCRHGRYHRRMPNNSTWIWDDGKWTKSKIGMKQIGHEMLNDPENVYRLNKPQSKRIEPDDEYEDC